MYKIIATMAAIVLAVTGILGIAAVCAESGSPLRANRQDSLLMNKVNGNIYYHVQVRFDTNKYFSRYDVRMFMDGKEIAVIPHGGFYEGILGLSGGYHVLKFAKSDNPEGIYGTSMVKVTTDSDYECIIHAYWSHVEIGNELQNGAAIDHAALDREVFIRECEHPDYDEIRRYPDKARGGKMKITGKVINVVDLPLVSSSLMALAEGENVWFVPFVRNRDEARILVDDTVTVYGVYKGLSSFYMGNGFVFGNWLAAYPTISAKYIIR